MPLFRKKKQLLQPPAAEPLKPLPTMDDLKKDFDYPAEKPMAYPPENTISFPAKTTPPKMEQRKPEAEEMEPMPQPARPEALRPRQAIAKEERPSAPLFIKLDRYKTLLSTINYMKTTLVMLKNSLAILNDLERVREENGENIS